MIAYALTAAFAMLGAAVAIALVRLLRGPTPLDRLLSFDLIAGTVVALIALLSIAWKEPFYLEAVLLFSIFGFLSTATMVFYLDMAVSRREPAGGHAPQEVIDPADSGDERYDA